MNDRKLLYKIFIVAGIALIGAFLYRVTNPLPVTQFFSHDIRGAVKEKVPFFIDFSVSESAPDKASKTRHKRGLHSKIFAVFFMPSKEIRNELVSVHYSSSSETAVVHSIIPFFLRGPPYL